MSGWGQSFVPPIERIVDHVGTRSYVSFCLATSVGKDVESFSHLLPSPCPRFLYLAFLCPHLYWAEYFYLANVVKVFLINLFCTLVM